VTHTAEVKLPAVSGSSGRLIISPPKDDAAEHTWPGQVFEDPTLDYTAAMQAFVAAARAEAQPGALPDPPVQAEKTSRREQKRQLRQETLALREARRQTRIQRKTADAAWRTLQQQRCDSDISNATWKHLRTQRQAELGQRQQADATWRQQLQHLREHWLPLPLVTAWIAILVVTDNCTRQCLGLPLFVMGPRVTAELIVEALRALLPSELHFLISDRGTHFRATAFRQLELSQEFIHVRIARHRPESNGIAERFVRTLKEWLADKVWTSDEQLAELLSQFIAEYNDRPHQGLALPGLSPNEFARRIGLL
jgi:transposase InsO family protein